MYDLSNKCGVFIIKFNDERQVKLNDFIIELDRRRVSFLHWLNMYTVCRSRSIEKYIRLRAISGSPLDQSYLLNS